MKTSLFLSTAACFALLSIGIARAEDGTVANSAPVINTTVTAAPSTSTNVIKNMDGSTTTTTTTTYYVDYDKNNNGILDSKEFYNYAYTAWDLNRDGWISDAEWKVSTARWYGPTSTQYKTYTYWDKNADGKIDASEFDTTITATPLYTTWDVNGDGTIGNDEYAAASFRLYDTNNDGVLSMDEWKYRM